jgi:MbtH protein
MLLPVREAWAAVRNPEGDTHMSWEDREDNTIYKVVVNHEEQYSIWPAHRENPVGKSGPKQECLDYIKEVWTDMRPLSLRKKMEEMEKQKQAAQDAN